MTLRTFALAPLAHLALVAPAGALELSGAEARAELAYARGLASDFALVGLAREVLDRAEAAGVPAALREELALAKCDVFAIGALSERDPQKRHAIFDQALDAYRSFISKNQRSGSLPEAEAAFVDTADKYAQSLAASLDSAVGDEVEALREKRVNVLSEAVAKTGELVEAMKSIPERSEKQNRQLYELMLRRGKMLTETARSQDNPTFSFEQSAATLEELVYLAGENSPYALLAFIAIGENNLARKSPLEAAYSFEFVVENAIPKKIEDWNRLLEEFELTQADKQTRWAFLELATPGLVRAYTEAGQADTALAWALHAYNTQKREGFALNVPAGPLALLAVADALLENGGFVGGSLAAGEAKWFATEDEMKAAYSNRRDRTTATDLALSIADTVNRENRGSMLQVRAQKLLKRISERPDVTPSPETLLEAAKGAYNERDFDEAISGFKRVLRVLENEDEATRKRSGGEIMNLLGKAYGRSERALLAAAAFREGLERFQGDDVYDSQNAQGYLQAAQIVLREAGVENEPTLGAMVKEAESFVLRFPTEGGNTRDAILWRDAEQLAAAKDWKGAQAKYRELEPGSDYYEKALVAIAYCDMRAGAVDQAVAAFDAYLENYVTDPKNAIVDSERRQARRQEAMAQAAHSRGFLAHLAATKSKSESDWRRVVDLLATYADDYRGQIPYSASAMRMVSDAYLALGEFDKARAVYDRMAGHPEISKRKDTDSVALAIYKELKDRRDAAEQAEERERYLDLTRRMALLLQAVNQNAASPAFNNLRNESRHWMELEDFAAAESVLKRIVERFAQENAKEIEDFVAPDLGQALLRQKKVAEAYAVLAPLAAGKDKKPSKQTVLDYARSVIGWIEGSDTDIVQVPGATKDLVAVEDATSKLQAIAGGMSKYTAEWYPINFEVLYAYYVWGTLDSKKSDVAQSAIKRFTSDMVNDPEYHAVEKALDEAGGELERQYGDDLLRRRYVWLRRKVGA